MQALMLAAGMGRRLGKNINKCMITISGATLFEHTKKALSNAGITKLIVVTGYHADELEEFICKKSCGMEVSFIRNKDYARTNNIWSLYLAKRELLEDDTILLESDIIFEKDLIKELVEIPFPDVAAVSKLESWMDGTTVLMDGNQIRTFVSKKDFNPIHYEISYKTVNIYKFSKEFLRMYYLYELESYIDTYGKSQFYEMVLKEMIGASKVNLHAHIVNGKWYEIDTADDLKAAFQLFNDKRSFLYNSSIGNARKGG